MYTKKHLNYRVLVAKGLAFLYSDPSDVKRCLKRVHEIYGEKLLGVEYDTLRKYVNMSAEELGKASMPGYVWAALLMLGFFRECERMGIPMPAAARYRSDELARYLERLLYRRAEIRMRKTRPFAAERMPEKQL